MAHCSWLLGKASAGDSILVGGASFFLVWGGLQRGRKEGRKEGRGIGGTVF